MSKLLESSSPAWKRLQKLRQSYLAAKGFLPDYWADEELLQAYDETLAQRIRWKWRAVWEALPATDLPRIIVDLACGSGAASREVLSLDSDRFDAVVPLDRSRRAVEFAGARIRAEFPLVRVLQEIPAGEKYLLLVSHVFSELPEEGLEAFRPLLKGAEAIVWVESGRHQESRRLVSLRESLRSTHHFLAPCPHQGICGMLREGQEENWCHFRAPVPKEVHHSAFWREAAKQLGIDLRALPVAYIFAQRGSGVDTDQVQILAGSREFKGFVRYHGCHREKVFSADFMKRYSKVIFDELSSPDVSQRFSLAELRKEEGLGTL